MARATGRNATAVPNFTAEQQAIIDAASSGGNGIAEAFAGAGKTTVTIGIALSRPRLKFHYLPFNRKTADEAKRKMPRHVTARTMHSIAFGAVGVKYKHKLAMPRQRYEEVADILGLQGGLQIREKSYLRRWQTASKILDCLKQFCYSADELPAAHHVKHIDGATPEYMVGAAEYIAQFAVKAWADIMSTQGQISWYKNHDYYLKMWALTHPNLHTDCLMVDEAQDSNGVTLQIVNDQDCQKILVGDPFQQLYGWRGAVDAMSLFKADWRLPMTQSFRFGEAIANEGNKWLALLESPNKLVGFDKIESTVGELDHAKTILCRTNAGVIAEAQRVIERGDVHAIVGGTEEVYRFARAVQDLQGGRQTVHPDLIGFENWMQVKEYVESGEGGDLKVLVDIVDKFGVGAIINIADTAVDENEGDPDTLLSTVHKAKGLEWRSVKLAGDFQEPVDPDTGERDYKAGRAEFMGLYVAVTRAVQKLDCTSVDWVNDWLDIPRLNIPNVVVDDVIRMATLEQLALNDQRLLPRVRRRRQVC